MNIREKETKQKKDYIHRRRDSSWAARLYAQAPQGTRASEGLLVQATPETQRGGRRARIDNVLSYLNSRSIRNAAAPLAEKGSQRYSRGARGCAYLLLRPIERGATRRDGAHRRSE